MDTEQTHLFAALHTADTGQRTIGAKKAEKPKVASAPTGIEATTLATEETALADRASKVPDDHYKIQYINFMCSTKYVYCHMSHT